MTPATDLARKAGIQHRIHHYEHDPAAASYGLEAAEKLGVPAQQVFKTLVARLESGTFAVAILPVTARLSLKALAKAAGARKAAMAQADDVQRVTGYVLGGVSPLGQKKNLLTVLDDSACAHSSVYVSAGRRGLEIELEPADLVTLTGARLARLASA